MKDIEQLMEEYGQEDLERRLDLFLEHRLLRKAFIDMEMEEISSPKAPPDTPAAMEPEKRTEPHYFCKRLLKWCFSREV